MFNKDKFTELNNRIIYKEEQNLLGISNSHFEILLKLANNKVLKPQHIPFAFSYLYLQTYLFRYTKYDDYVPSVSDIKEILTYDKSNKTLNYIIKDGGALDSVNLTKTIYDFPIYHEWVDGGLEFTLVSRLNNDNEFGRKWRQGKGINYNASCKYPVLAFYDELDSFNEISVNNNNGTFFSTFNLTLIDWNIFNYCMSNDELGCNGFYLYSFIKSQEGKLGSCMLGLSKISTYTGLSSRSISRYIKSLREFNLIQCVSATFVIGADKVKGEVEKESNTYFANEYEDIKSDKLKLDKPNFISLSHYLEKKQLESVNIDNCVVEPMIDELL